MKKLSFTIAAFILFAFSTSVFSQSYLSESFETAFTGSPAAPTGFTQSRIVLVGEENPANSLTTMGPKDWRQAVYSGSSWNTGNTGEVPPGAQNGTGALFIEDAFFGPVNSVFGSRRIESPMLSPLIITATSPYVRFFLFYAEPSDKVNLRIVASSNNGTTWNFISIVPANFTPVNSTNTWEEINILLPVAYRTVTSRVGIEMVNTDGNNNIYIDNFRVEQYTPNTITSANSGTWNSPSTWVGGQIPRSGNNVVIANNHTVSVDPNIARCQNLTVFGTLQYNGTSATELLHVYGNFEVGSGGNYISANGTSGKRTYVGGNFTNSTNGNVDFSRAGSNLVWVGGTMSIFSGNGMFANNRLAASSFANGAGVTFNSDITITGTVSLYVGSINPNGNLTLGDNTVSTSQLIQRINGSFTTAPDFSNGVRRSYTYGAAIMTLNPLDTVTIQTGPEIEFTSGRRYIGGNLTINTHNNVALTERTVVGDGTSDTLKLQRGILITTEANILECNFAGNVTGSMGVAPDTQSPPLTHGSYVSGPMQYNMQSGGSGTKHFGLGSGTEFNGQEPSGNVLKTFTYNSTAFQTQEMTVRVVETNPTGEVNEPLGQVIGARAFLVEFDGGQGFGSSDNISVYYDYDKDSLSTTQGGFKLATAPNITGTWTNRTNVTFTGALPGTGMISTDSPLPVNDTYVAFATTDGSNGIVQNTSDVPTVYNLSQNFPNPFNPTTKISFGIPKNGLVTMKIYDMVGKEVATLVNNNLNAGTYTVDFTGALLSSGVYFYRIQANDFVQVRKMILVK